MASRNDIQYIRFYTDGSAARKIAPAAAADYKPLPQMKAKKKRITVHVDPVAILSILVAVCMLVCIGVGFVRTTEARQQTQKMQEYAQQLQEKNASLQEKYTDGYDLQSVKQTALALGMIPREQAQHISMEITVPQQEQTVTLWTKIGTFLAGLIA